MNSDDEQFCGRCLAGVTSDEHHGKCVAPGFASEGEPARDLNAMPEGERVVAGPTRTVWTKAGQWTNGED